jgi:hypothetical protein
MDWLDALVTFLATLIGVAAGVPVALWIDRKVSSRHRKEEEVYFLHIVKDNLSHNVDLMNQIQRELRVETVLFYHLDLSPWQTHSGRLDSVENRELVQRIARTYYELEHLNRKMDLQLEMAYSAFRAISGYSSERASLVQAILGHIAVILPLAQKTIALIDNELHHSQTTE